MRVRECQYCKCLVEEASWCDCAEAERDMRAFDLMVRASRSAPKPTTPEQPECKLDWPGKDQGFAMGTADKPPEWKGPQPACSPLDRALEDFTARRKAKREALPATGHDWPHDSGLLFSKRLCRKCGLNGANIRSATVCDGPRAVKPSPAVARAMSTPLDPDIHTRLMPWRGKE